MTRYGRKSIIGGRVVRLDLIVDVTEQHLRHKYGKLLLAHDLMISYLLIYVEELGAGNVVTVSWASKELQLDGRLGRASNKSKSNIATKGV